LATNKNPLKKTIAQHQHVKPKKNLEGGGDHKKVIDKGLGTKLLQMTNVKCSKIATINKWQDHHHP
jgi:hypothetical protein